MDSTSKGVMFKHVKSPELKAKMVNPLFMRGDLGIKRYLRLVKNHLRQFGNFNKYYK